MVWGEPANRHRKQRVAPRASPSSRVGNCLRSRLRVCSRTGTDPRFPATRRDDPTSKTHRVKIHSRWTGVSLRHDFSVCRTQRRFSGPPSHARTSGPRMPIGRGYRGATGPGDGWEAAQTGLPLRMAGDCMQALGAVADTVCEPCDDCDRRASAASRTADAGIGGAGTCNADLGLEVFGCAPPTQWTRVRSHHERGLWLAEGVRRMVLAGGCPAGVSAAIAGGSDPKEVGFESRGRE